MDNDFLNQKSMLTPAIAGAIVFLITNTLSLQFDLPHKWVALSLSALLSLLYAIKVGNIKGRKIENLIYGILNCLIIFTFASGGSEITAKLPNSSTFKTVQNISPASNNKTDEFGSAVAIPPRSEASADNPKSDRKIFFQAWFK